MKLRYETYFSDYIDNFYSCYHKNKQWQEEPNRKKEHVVWEVIFGFPWGCTAHATLFNSKPRIIHKHITDSFSSIASESYSACFVEQVNQIFSEKNNDESTMMMQAWMFSFMNI